MESRFPPVGFEPVAKGHRLLFKEAVVACAVDAFVEFDIGPVEGFGISASARASAGLVRGRERGAILTRMPAARQRRTGSFEKRHRLEHFRQPDHGELHDGGTLVGLDLHQSARSQKLQSLAYGCPGNAEALCQRFLLEFRARLEDAGNDFAFEGGADAVRASSDVGISVIGGRRARVLLAWLARHACFPGHAPIARGTGGRSGCGRSDAPRRLDRFMTYPQYCFMDP